MKKHMNVFILRNEGMKYKLYCNDNIVTQKEFTSKNEAIEYFKASISSYVKYQLELDLTEVKRKEQRSWEMNR